MTRYSYLEDLLSLNSIRGFDVLGRRHCIYLITRLPLEISLLLPLTYDFVPPAHHSYLLPHSQVAREQICHLRTSKLLDKLCYSSLVLYYSITWHLMLLGIN